MSSECSSYQRFLLLLEFTIKRGYTDDLIKISFVLKLNEVHKDKGNQLFIEGYGIICTPIGQLKAN